MILIVLMSLLLVYPTTNVKWMKKVHRDPEVEVKRSERLSIDSYQESQTTLVSRLTIQQVEEADTGVYMCTVGGVGRSIALSVQMYTPVLLLFIKLIINYLR